VSDRHTHPNTAVGLLSEVFQAHTWYDVKCRKIVTKCQEREPMKSLLPSTKSLYIYIYVCVCVCVFFCLLNKIVYKILEGTAVAQ